MPFHSSRSLPRSSFSLLQSQKPRSFSTNQHLATSTTTPTTPDDPFPILADHRKLLSGNRQPSVDYEPSDLLIICSFGPKNLTSTSPVPSQPLTISGDPPGTSSDHCSDSSNSLHLRGNRQILCTAAHCLDCVSLYSSLFGTVQHHFVLFGYCCALLGAVWYLSALYGCCFTQFGTIHD